MMSDASVPDREIAHFSFEASPSPLKSAAVSDLSALSAASVATPFSVSFPSPSFFDDLHKNMAECQEESRRLHLKIDEQLKK